MLSFLKKRVLGINSKPVAVPVVTAFASPVPLLARDASGRNVKKVVDTNTVYNQFEQLKKFQHNNSTPDKVCEEKKPRTLRQGAKIPWMLLLLVAVVSAITASVVVLTYSSLYLHEGKVIGVGVDTRIGREVPLRIVSQPQQLELHALVAAQTNMNHDTTKNQNVVVSPSVSVYKVIHIRKESSSDQKALPGIDNTVVKDSPLIMGIRVKRSVRRIYNAMVDIFMVPVELKHEIDFNFH